VNDRSTRFVDTLAPRPLDEIVVAARAYKPVSLGESIQIDGRPLTIVGRAARAGNSGFDGEWALVAPQTLDALVESNYELQTIDFRMQGVGAFRSDTELLDVLGRAASLIGQPVRGATSGRLAFIDPDGGQGNWVQDRAEYFDSLPFDRNVATAAIGSTLLSALLGVQVVLVAATVFNVGMRRRAREFGQLVTVGADRHHIGRLALIEAGVLGVAGAIVGRAT